MRARLISVLLTVTLVAALAPLAAAPGAAADPDRGQPDPRPAGQPAGAAVRADDPTKVRIRSRLVFKANDKIFLRGAVNPPSGPVFIQRATRCDRDQGTCNFQPFRKVFLNDAGQYKAPIAAPPTRRGWVWRAQVKQSFSRSWLTCTKPRNAQDKPCRVPYPPS